MAEEVSPIFTLPSMHTRAALWPLPIKRRAMLPEYHFHIPIYHDFQPKKLHLDITKIQQSIHRYNEKYCGLQHTLGCSEMGSKSISIYRLEGLDLAKGVEASEAFVSL
jgi:hypothetical protein